VKQRGATGLKSHSAAHVLPRPALCSVPACRKSNAFRRGLRLERPQLLDEQVDLCLRVVVNEPRTQ
jgi:hypothetical protein